MGGVKMCKKSHLCTPLAWVSKIVSEKVIEAKGNSWLPFENQTFSDGRVSTKESAFGITGLLKRVVLKADGSSNESESSRFRTSTG